MPTSQLSVRVLVVDDHPVVREGLAAIIGTQRDMVVVGEAANAEEAIAACAACRPDGTLMDLCLPGASGIDLAARLRGRWPELRVIMFTSFAREHEIYEAFKAGICSYIRKGAARSELLQAIRAVHAGQRYISPEIDRTGRARGTAVRSSRVSSWRRSSSSIPRPGLK